MFCGIVINLVRKNNEIYLMLVYIMMVEIIGSVRFGLVSYLMWCLSIVLIVLLVGVRI